MKKCSRCHVDKEDNDFDEDRRSLDGLKKWCKACVSEYNKSRYADPVFKLKERIRLLQVRIERDRMELKMLLKQKTGLMLRENMRRKGKKK